jgi:hypothetical protein
MAAAPLAMVVKETLSIGLHTMEMFQNRNAVSKFAYSSYNIFKNKAKLRIIYTAL